MNEKWSSESTPPLRLGGGAKKKEEAENLFKSKAII